MGYNYDPDRRDNGDSIWSSAGHVYKTPAQEAAEAAARNATKPELTAADMAAAEERLRSFAVELEAEVTRLKTALQMQMWLEQEHTLPGCWIDVRYRLPLAPDLELRRCALLSKGRELVQISRDWVRDLLVARKAVEAAEHAERVRKEAEEVKTLKAKRTPLRCKAIDWTPGRLGFELVNPRREKIWANCPDIGPETFKYGEMYEVIVDGYRDVVSFRKVKP